MKNTFLYLAYIIIYLVVFTACHDEKLDTDISLRSASFSFYAPNEQKSMLQLNRIINNTDSDKTYERFKIIHISDIHISDWTADNRTNSPQNLMEVVKFANTPEHRINIIAATGDLIDQSPKTDKQTACKYMRQFVSTYYTGNTIPSFICTGNHDANMLTDNKSYFLNKQDIHDIIFSKKNYTLQQLPGENYYYADINNPQGGIIRIIAMDNVDQENYTYSSHHISLITQKQVDWLINTALKDNMTGQHSIIILNHHPYQPYSKDYSTYMCAGKHLYNEKLVPDIINAFIKKKIIDQTFKGGAKPIHVQADFTKAKGEFVCHLGGHAHTFGQFEVACTNPDAAKQIMLLSNTLSPERQNQHYHPIERSPRSIHSNSFAIYAIDTKEKNIYRTYFGASPFNILSIDTIPYR